MAKQKPMMNNDKIFYTELAFGILEIHCINLAFIYQNELEENLISIQLININYKNYTVILIKILYFHHSWSKFTSLHDAAMPYTSTTFCFLATLGALHSTLDKTAITEHINSGSFSGGSNQDIGSFKILAQCNNDYKANFQEASLIKNLNQS